MEDPRKSADQVNMDGERCVVFHGCLLAPSNRARARMVEHPVQSWIIDEGAASPPLCCRRNGVQAWFLVFPQRVPDKSTFDGTQ